jgi:hypothetical protein
VLVAAAALAAAAGISGSVVIDPAKPVCQVGQPCTAPDAHEQLVFWRGTSRVAAIQTDDAGRFTVRLAPGIYRLTLPRRKTMARLTPTSVRVPSGRVVRVTFHLDIGIR